MKHVLFLCIGNSCRSQMAEAFARKYGGDAMHASSAGLSPATYIAPFTRQVMTERNISLDDHFPKPLNLIDMRKIDLVINMTGGPLLNDLGAPVFEWRIEDPIGQSIEKFRQIADQLESLVMQLVISARHSGAAAAPSPSEGHQPGASSPRPAARPAGGRSGRQDDALKKPLPPKFGRPRIPRP
jgi:arsenate reductase (thioredoxin)